MDCCFLEDEKFDFDLPLSSDDEKENEVDDDEIFFGPVGHRERCLATHASSRATKILENDNKRDNSHLNIKHKEETCKQITSGKTMLLESSPSCDVASDNLVKRGRNLPELLADIDESKISFEIEKEEQKLVHKYPESNDGYVVRRRVLKEKNVSNSLENKKPCNLERTKAPMKQENEKTLSKKAVSKADRNDSSSASDTSFGEEKVRKSGLKVPGFTACPRRRTSSNSSTSSSSSLPSVNLNETFTLPQPGDLPKTSNIRPPSNRKIKAPSTKGMITKGVTTKPMFAKPSEVPKASKLQPLKAVQARTMSGSAVRSPARVKANTRPASVGTTPLKAQTPRADKTPTDRVPLRRRSATFSANNTSVKAKLNMSTSAIQDKSFTPRSGIPGAGKVPGSSGLAANWPGNVSKRILNKPSSVQVEKKLSTPERRAKNYSRNTPEKKVVQDSKPALKKRRSLLPTPNLNKTESKIRNKSNPCSGYESPDTSKTIERARNLIKKLDLNKKSPKTMAAKSSNHVSENDIYKETISKKEIVSGKDVKESNDNLSSKANEYKDVKVNDKDLKPTEKTQEFSNVCCPNVKKDDEVTKSPQVKEVADLMSLTSPDIPETELVDITIDPFSPGIDSPNLTADVLNPIVVLSHTKDLIDLSYQSPRSEEAKLVDI